MPIFPHAAERAKVVTQAAPGIQAFGIRLLRRMQVP
jgi:hypothetical protein